MPAVDDLAGVIVVPTPKGERLVSHQRFTLCAPRNNHPSLQHVVHTFGSSPHSAFIIHHSHPASSRITRPITAERTQSARLPKVMCVPSKPGA